MKEQLLVLWQLQQLEQQQKLLQKELEQLNSDSVRNLWQEIQLITHNIAADEEKLTCQRKICETLEEEIRRLSHQCQQFEDQLYSGRIKNSRELKELQEKQQMIKRDIHEREEEAFAKLEYCEQLAGKITAQQALLQAKKGSHSHAQQQLVSANARLAAQITALKQECNTLASQLDDKLFKLYSDLKRTRREPLAKVENGVCGGCRCSIPLRQVSQSCEDIQFCENCGRILLVSE